MQKSKKNIHKEIIKYVRSVNKQLKNDEYLGLNRFRVDLFAEKWHKYSDNSGYCVTLLVKITDNLTKNKCVFSCDNYDYKYGISIYANDFLIRCSSGASGHFPTLNYIAYDVHEIVPYTKDTLGLCKKVEDGVIDTYNWLNCEV